MPVGYVIQRMSDDDANSTTRRGLMGALLAAVGLGSFYAGSATADDGDGEQ